MTITQMECFVEAAKSGSFSRAAELLFISQQTMSRQIRAMETELGFPLFERHNMGVLLTEQGRILYDAVSEMIIKYRSAVDKAKDRYLGVGNKIRIGIYDFGRVTDEIVKCLMDFNERYPELDLEYYVDSAAELCGKLQRGQLNIVIVYESELINMPDVRRLKIRNYQSAVGLCMSKYHPLATRKKVSLSQLSDGVCGILSPEASGDFKERVVEFLRSQGMENKILLREYNSRRNLQLALVTGKCYSIIYEDVMMGMEDKLAFFPLDIEDYFSKIVLAWTDEKCEIKAKNILNAFEER